MESRLHSSLQKSFLCSGLPVGQLAEIAQLVSYLRCNSGEILFHKGAPADRFFAVLEGHVVLSLDEGGQGSDIARIVHPGETFAEAAICGCSTYPVTAEVLGPTLLAAIPSRALCTLFEQRFDLVLRILGMLSMQLRGLVREIAALKMKSSAQRLGSYLLSQTTAEEGSAEIHLPYQKKLLALELGMQPETLSRAFLKLQAIDVAVLREGDTCRIGDVAALRDFCQASERETLSAAAIGTGKDTLGGAIRPARKSCGQLPIAEDALDAVCASPLFSGLSRETVVNLIGAATVHCYEQDQLLFSAGDAADAFFIVLEGSVKLFALGADGSETIIEIVGAGASFAEAAMFASASFPLECEAIEETRLVKIHRNDFLRRLNDEPSLALQILASLGRWQLHLMGELWQLKAHTPAQRLAYFLVLLSDKERGPASIELPYPKGVIARRIGITPESLSRALARLNKLGVETHAARVTIEDIGLVRRFCGM